MRQTLKSGGATSAFAALLGFGRASANAADDNDDDKPDASADDDDTDDTDKDSKKSKKAKADDDDADDTVDDPDKGKDSKKSKKAKADDDDTDDTVDDEDKDKDARADGRKAERSRWSKVLQSKEAGQGRVAAACEMLANTSMSADVVIKTLAALPSVAGLTGLAGRMATVPATYVGDGGGAPAPKAGSPEAVAAAIVAAGKKRRGEK